MLANCTGLVEAPPVADTLKVPFGANVGAAGLAMKLVIACAAAPMVTVERDLRGGGVVGVCRPGWRSSEHTPADSIVTVLPLTEHTEAMVLANSTGLVEAPPVAETVKVPLGAIGRRGRVGDEVGDRLRGGYRSRHRA